MCKHKNFSNITNKSLESLNHKKQLKNQFRPFTTLLPCRRNARMGLPPAPKLLRWWGVVELAEEVPPFSVLGLPHPDHHWGEAIATN